MPSCNPLLLIINLITVALGLFNSIRYTHILKLTRSTTAAILSFASILTVMGGGYAAAEWIVYCQLDSAGEILLKNSHDILGVSLLVFCLLQTLFLLWRPKAFRKTRRGDSGR